MFFTIGLWVAVAIFLFGLFYNYFSWHRRHIGGFDSRQPFGQRLAASWKSVAKAFFSAKVLNLLWIFLADALAQRKIYKENRLRWLTHMFIYGGFFLLLFMHALDNLVVKPFSPGAEPTLYPFIFLRNVFGAVAIAGIIMAACRRLRVRPMRLTTRSMDIYSIIILAVIMVSGFVLEGSKIISQAKFDEMVEFYSDSSEEEDLQGLRAVWAKDYGVVFAEPLGEISEEVWQRGEELHQSSCLSCHSRPEWAFLSFGVSRGFRPFALGLDAIRFDQILWHIHWLACFIGLAYLPFSKFYHVLTSPLSLIANGLADKAALSPVNRATKQFLELDACTHCATCTIHCSVGVYVSQNPNLNILPSEKLAAMRRLAKGQRLSLPEIKAIQEAAYICTNCYRCTLRCPVGIDCHELWVSLKEDLSRRGHPDTYVAARENAGLKAAPSRRLSRLQPGDGGFRAGLGLSAQASTFSRCFTCQTCTNVCPVVASFAKPKEALDLLPHQIMHMLSLGLKDEAAGAGMVWNCLTCYHCQESCPQGVKVTDVLFELRNLAAQAKDMSQAG